MAAVLCDHDEEHRSRQAAGMEMEKQLRAYILTLKLGAEREQTKSGMGF